MCPGPVPSAWMARSASQPRVVALVGVDGSGKTTQARRLADWLAAAGVPARYALNAGGRRWLSRVARRLGRRDARHLLGRRGLLLVEAVLRWLAIARALLLARVGGQVAVMDRYSYCQYVSIRAQSGTADGLAQAVARLAYRLFPRPDLTILLDVDPAVAYQRIERRGTDHESMGFLAAAARAYRQLPESPDFVVVDADPDPDRVTRAVRAEVVRLFGRGQPPTGGADRPVDALAADISGDAAHPC